MSFTYLHEKLNDPLSVGDRYRGHRLVTKSYIRLTGDLVVLDCIQQFTVLQSDAAKGRHWKRTPRLVTDHLPWTKVAK